MAPERTGWTRADLEIVRETTSRPYIPAAMPEPVKAARTPRREFLDSLEEEFCRAGTLIVGFTAETLVTIALLMLFDVLRLVADPGPDADMRSRLLEVAHDGVLFLWVFASVCRAFRLFMPNLWRAVNAPMARLANKATVWKEIGSESKA